MNKIVDIIKIITISFMIQLLPLLIILIIIYAVYYYFKNKNNNEQSEEKKEKITKNNKKKTKDMSAMDLAIHISKKTDEKK